MKTVEDLRTGTVTIESSGASCMYNFVSDGAEGLIYNKDFKIKSVGDGKYELVTWGSPEHVFTPLKAVSRNGTHLFLHTRTDVIELRVV